MCVDLPSRPAVMAALAGAKQRQRQAEIALVATAADAYGWVATDPSRWGDPSVLHGERLIQIGADGTPLVAEFITHEVGPALQVGPDAAYRLIADVLNLRHRLPLVWASTLDGRCEVWVARKLAALTRELAAEACRWVDAHLEWMLTGATTSQLLDGAKALVVRADADAAEARRQAALRRRYVYLAEPHDEGPGAGVRDLFGRLEAGDAARLDWVLNVLADRLADQAVGPGKTGSRTAPPPSACSPTRWAPPPTHHPTCRSTPCRRMGKTWQCGLPGC